MCGRFTNRFTWEELHERLDLIGVPLNLRPRYNVAPSQDVAVARAADPGSRSGASEGRTLAMLRWGLIPAWAKNAAVGYKLINARSETAAEKPSFRSAFRHRRCLIPADGFYEWQRRGGTPQPWLFGLRDVNRLSTLTPLGGQSSTPINNRGFVRGAQLWPARRPARPQSPLDFTERL